ncbi:MAG: L-serine ammonia-lyase, iron-sulfur-dependent, subunit alpha, partial [Oscillospiraceae bacterium]|nr:L-serine ammonia-lyase, iron-sulfur-dependent, subunit alpha [Oscillospiraceae bacterium]
LFTAAGFGSVIAERACISGAEGGCQAECGAAAAMAAAAVELLGGTPQMCADACALSLKFAIVNKSHLTSKAVNIELKSIKNIGLLNKNNGNVENLGSSGSLSLNLQAGDGTLYVLD